MAENKKSFVLYSDLIHNIDHLTNEEKGILFQHLLEYVNDLKPVLKDRLVLTAWKPIERQLKRDLQKFEDVKGKRSEAGKRSAELRALKKIEQNPTNPTRVESVEECSTNPTVNVNDNENVNDNNNKGKIVDDIFKSYKLKYKIYAKELFQDAGNLENISRVHKISSDKSVFTPTIKKYYVNFLVQLDISQEKHESKGKFNTHFSNWLRKQNIKNVIEPQKSKRYV